LPPGHGIARHLAPIELVSGTTSLYASDLWNKAAKNEALANFSWSFLGFDADGAIKPITREKSVELALATGSLGRQLRVPNVDVTTGVVGFTSYCDIRGAIVRAQAFVPTRSGTLSSLAFTSFHDGNVDAGITLAIYAANGRSLVLDAAVCQHGGLRSKRSRHHTERSGNGWGSLFARRKLGGYCRLFRPRYHDDAETSRGGAQYSNDSGKTFKPAWALAQVPHDRHQALTKGFQLARMFGHEIGENVGVDAGRQDLE
jgi:hypothetical protein